MNKKSRSQYQKVKRHIKGDIKTFEKEAKEDKKLLKSLKGKNGKKRK